MWRKEAKEQKIQKRAKPDLHLLTRLIQQRQIPLCTFRAARYDGTHSASLDQARSTANASETTPHQTAHVHLPCPSQVQQGNPRCPNFRASDGYLPEKLIHHIFKQLANAVVYLHRNGWIHGDLKEEVICGPLFVQEQRSTLLFSLYQNIVVDEHYNAELIDFGVARKVPKSESDLFGPRDYLGSISRVAPEILREQGWQAASRCVGDWRHPLFIVVPRASLYHSRASPRW
ncbi:hypothetical protein BJ742DRAFT_845959 [Cladochytrium replicatum]|nr:hypothetical protein BJ742DRAFT_845959 [Cladochytrium replicatum]